MNESRDDVVRLAKAIPPKKTCSCSDPAVSLARWTAASPRGGRKREASREEATEGF